MKKINIIIFVLLLAFGIAGCSDEKENEKQDVVEDVQKDMDVEEDGEATIDKPTDEDANNSQANNENENYQITKTNIYLVAIEDNGKGGKKLETGDSLIPVELDITPSINPLEATLNNLLSIKDQFYGESGLYNALYQSNLTVDSTVIKDDIAEIRLSGNFALGGVMDGPRAKAQIEETAMQFDNVKSVNIYVDDKTIDDALSLKGE
ncbi:MAG: hypothetical protein K0Q97_1227 [Bacillota bacterium]|jgi:hypothetical protein|nr:hypothetical protein [Bacillota bacterium]